MTTLTQPNTLPADQKIYYQNLKGLTGDLVEFLATQNNVTRISSDDLQATYTQSGEYLVYVTQYHHSVHSAQFILDLAQRITPDQSIIDVGCASGFSGLSLVKLGYHNVTFHDYAGLGLEFIRWWAKREDLPLVTIPYTNPTESKYDWVLCMDVLEHTGNHLGCLKWLEGLGDNVALCYPLMGFDPPYVNCIDQWVDDEIIQMTISKRYHAYETKVVDGRRYTTYRTR